MPECQVADATKRTCEWLIEIDLHGPTCEMIVDEARLKLAMRSAAGPLPTPPKGFDLPVDEIIRRTKPAPDDTIDIVASHAHWLYNWAFFAFPDPGVCAKALDPALKQQYKR